MKKKWGTNNKLFLFDQRVKKKTLTKIIGCDEVGRGSLAGPIVLCCLILKDNFSNFEIQDSKKINFNTRSKLSNIIKKNSIYFFTYIDNKEIDKINPLEATKKAISISLEKFTDKNVVVLLDYITNYSNDKFIIYNLKKGDNLSLSIASASILAKVERDNYMISISKKFNNYAFEKNKGYGTKEHLKLIEKNGACNLHRLSYKPLKSI